MDGTCFRKLTIKPIKLNDRKINQYVRTYSTLADIVKENESGDGTVEKTRNGNEQY